MSVTLELEHVKVEACCDIVRIGHVRDEHGRMWARRRSGRQWLVITAPGRAPVTLTSAESKPIFEAARQCATHAEKRATLNRLALAHLVAVQGG